MASHGTRKSRIAVAVCSAALIGIGVFFAAQDLGTAAKYAGVGSFFIGLIGCAMTGSSLFLSIRTTRNAGRTPAPETALREPPAEDPAPSRDRAFLIHIDSITDSQVVNQPQKEVTINVDKS
jgi:hypothetical protein